MFRVVPWLKRSVWLPKDQPRAPEGDPCSLMQHCLAVRINGTDDDPCLDRRGVDATFIPHLGWWRRSLHLHSPCNHQHNAEVQATIRVWIDGASMQPSSHTKKIGEKPRLHQSLTEHTDVQHGPSVDKPVRRSRSHRWGLQIPARFKLSLCN